jgi:hypothetical protein
MRLPPEDDVKVAHVALTVAGRPYDGNASRRRGGVPGDRRARQATEVRRAMFIGAGGLATYLLVAFLIQPTFRFPMGPVALVWVWWRATSCATPRAVRMAGTDGIACTRSGSRGAALHGRAAHGHLVGAYAFPVLRRQCSDDAGRLRPAFAATCYSVLAYVERRLADLNGALSRDRAGEERACPWRGAS